MKKKKNATLNSQLSTRNSQDAATARQLVDQYEVVVSAEKSCFRERVKFGAMLLEWERYLGEARGGEGGTSGKGLKGWLERNCPEIGYNAAMEYKGYAQKALAMLGNSAKAVAALLGRETAVQPDGAVVDVDGAVVKQCDDLFEDVTSRRKLEQAWFAFAKERGAAALAGNGERAKLPMRSALENAKTIWARTLTAFSAKTLTAAIALLPEKETEVCWGVVKDLYDALKAHREELAR